MLRVHTELVVCEDAMGGSEEKQNSRNKKENNL
jgi:hypothetical protein